MELEKGRNLIFIGGVPRSGTSLIQKILDSNSNIYAGPEFDHLPALCSLYLKMKEGIISGRQSDYYDIELLKKSFFTFIESILITKCQSEKVKLISEKTPSNILFFVQLKELFPKAKFVFVLRDPRGNINSFKGVAKRALKFGDKVNIGSDIYKDLNLINTYIKAGETFLKNNSNQCYLVKYETLLGSPESEVRKLCDFLAVKFENQMLELSGKINDSSKLVNSEHPSVRAWSTPGMLDKPIDQRNANNWINQLTKQELKIIDDYFSSNKSDCLKSYRFKSLTKLEKLSLGTFYFKHLGFTYLLRRAFGSIKQNIISFKQTIL